MINLFKKKVKLNIDEDYENDYIKNLSVSKKPTSKMLLPISILVGVFLLCAVGTVYFSYFDMPDDNTNKIKSPKENVLAAKKQKQIKTEPENEIINLAGLENPFVTKQSPIYVDNAPQKAGKTVNTANTNLPAIPNYNYPSGTLPPIPAISGDLPKMSLPKQSPQIQGISSNEKGQNIAIVDGQVLKEGDKFNGSTISNINSSGITFSNGNQIAYNIAK